MPTTGGAMTRQLRLLDGGEEAPAGLRAWAARVRRHLDLRAAVRELRDNQRASAKERDELVWEIAILGEALEAILETRPRHITRDSGVKKHCAQWPNCNHACGEGLHSAHGIAAKALSDAFGSAWVERLRQRQSELQDDEETGE